MTARIHLMDNRDDAGRAVSLCGQPQSTGPEAEKLITYNLLTGLKRNQFNDTFCLDCVRLYKEKHAYTADVFEDIPGPDEARLATTLATLAVAVAHQHPGANEESDR